MPRPPEGYRLKTGLDAGKRVPGTSTVAKLIADPGGLIHWSNQEGLAGRDYRDTLQQAATAGSLVHAAVEEFTHGREPSWEGPPDLVAKAQRGYSAFLEWTKQTRLKVEQSELSLVSEVHRYGGTFDSILIGNRRVMCDYKTSAAIYPEHLLQVVAYARLWEEHHPEQPITGGFYILRFSRDYGDFAANWYAELDEAWAAFLHCRALYDLKAALAKRCR